MKKCVMTLCAFALTAVATMAQTAESPAVLKLSLDEAIDLALSENPTVKVADLEIERYDYVRKETLGSLYPSLSVSGTYTRAIVKTEISKGLSFGADNTIAASADIALPLIVPSVWRTARLNQIEMQNAVESARASRIDLVNSVKKGYYNILLAQQSLAVLKASEANVQQTVDDTRLQYEHGLASEYDLITAEVQLSNLQPSIIQTTNSIDVAKRLLKMYMSLPDNVDIELEGSLDDFREAVLSGKDGLSTDISQNSALRQLDIQADMLEQQLKVAQTSRMPTLSAFGSVSISGNDMERLNFGAMTGGSDGSTSMPGTTESVKNSFYWQHPISAGIQLSIPIFSGFRNTNKLKQLRNSMAQLDLQRIYLQQSTEVEVRSSINDLLTARETMFANEKTVQQAQKAYDISNTRYKAGAGTILELNTSELALTQARLNYSQAIYDYLSAKADYDRIVGRER